MKVQVCMNQQYTQADERTCHPAAKAKELYGCRNDGCISPDSEPLGEVWAMKLNYRNNCRLPTLLQFNMGCVYKTYLWT